MVNEFTKENTPLTLVFLDVDGVLNNTFECKMSKDPPQFAKDIIFKSRSWFHADKMLRLSRIVRETNAKVVISSNWRDGLYNFVAKMLDDFLIEHPYGATPCVRVTGKYLGSYEIRGDQIAWYLLRNFTDDEISKMRVIILDDSDDMGVLKASGVLFQTNSYMGLTDTIVHNAISAKFGNVSHLIQKMKEIEWNIDPRDADASNISCKGSNSSFWLYK